MLHKLSKVGVEKGGFVRFEGFKRIYKLVRFCFIELE